MRCWRDSIRWWWLWLLWWLGITPDRVEITVDHFWITDIGANMKEGEKLSFKVGVKNRWGRALPLPADTLVALDPKDAGTLTFDPAVGQGTVEGAIADFTLSAVAGGVEGKLAVPLEPDNAVATVEVTEIKVGVDPAPVEVPVA